MVVLCVFVVVYCIVLYCVCMCMYCVCVIAPLTTCIPQHNRTGGCFLKFDVPSDIRAEATMLSGTIPGVPLPPRPGGSTPPPPIPQQTCTTRDGWDFFGNDMNDGCASGQRVESLAACCARCQATSGCRAFSYVKPTSPWCPGMCLML